VLLVLVIAALFFSGFFIGGHYCDRDYREDFLVPEEGTCIQRYCQPCGPMCGAHCYERVVPCP
jgi:hypothetical protein